MSKKLALLFYTCFLLIAKLSVAQAPNWLWVEGSGGGNWEYGYGISIDPSDTIFIDGRCANTIALGGLNATAGGGTSPFMEKFDSSGKGKWLTEKTYSGGFDYTEGFYRDNKDNTYSTGIINGGLGGMFIDKYNSAGILQWAVTISNGISGLGVTADNSGNVYVTGIFTNGSYTFGSTTLSYSGSYNAIFLTKLDSDGNYIWAKSIYGTGSGDGNDNGRDIITDNNGNIYFCGDYTGSPVFGSVNAPTSSGISDFFIAKYDTAGNTEWVTTATNSFAGTFGGSNVLTVDSCGNLYATGGFAGTAQYGNLSVTSTGGNDIFVTQCNNSGQWQWVQGAGGTGNDAGSAIALDKNNYVYTAGNFANSAATFGSINLSSGDVFVAKYANSNGAVQWVQSATASGGIHGITVDNSNYVYATGGFRYYAKFGADSIPASSTENIFIAKLDTIANRTIAGVFDSAYCPNLYEPLPYSVSGTFNPGNIFTAQLSDSSGSFVSAVIIGSVTSTTSGIINVKISNGTLMGSHYHIRIVSSDPVTSSDVSCNSYVSIGKSLQFVLFGDTTICTGTQAKLSVSGGSTYLWGNGSTNTTITVMPVKDSTFNVTVGNGICTKDTFINVNIDTPLALIIKPASPTVCNGQGITLSISNVESSFSWSPSSSLSSSTTDSTVASPTATTTYILTCSDTFGCSVTGDVAVTVDSCSIVWPGDANNDSVANNYDLISIGIYYGDTGIMRNSITNSWLPHLAKDWSSVQYNGLNKKYVDCNGDGIINSDDTLAIYLNYDLTHNLPVQGSFPDTLQEVVPFYFTADSSSYYPGSPVHISVWLGTSAQQATMLYAFGYDIGLNTSLLQPGTLAFNYVNSFIGTKNSDALTLTHLNNDVETAVARIDHHNRTGNGKIGDLYFNLSSSITATQYILSLTSYEAVDSAGNPIIFQFKNDTLTIHQKSGINRLSVNDEKLSVYPNPASTQLTIVSYQLSINKIEIENVLGQKVFENTLANKQNSSLVHPEFKQVIDISDFPSGTYFISITTNNEMVTKKILVTK